MSNATLFETLRESHEIQRTLCRQLVLAKKDMAKRESIFMDLKVELEAHAAAEERFLYAVVLMDDAGLSSSRHALAEHHEIEEQLELMSVRDKSTDAWLEKARELGKIVRHHLKEEETKFFQLCGRILSDKEKKTLTKKYEKDLKRMRKKLAS